jgi:hypothetical protein
MLLLALSLAPLGQPFEIPSSLLEVAPPVRVDAEVTLPAELPAPMQDAPERAKFSYTYIEVGWNSLTLDDNSVTDDDVNTYYVRASLGLGLFHVFGSYENQAIGFQDTSTDLYRLGAGVHFGLTPKLDLVGEAAWLYSDMSSDLAALDDTTDGFEGRAGARWMPIVWGGGGFELDGNFVYVDLENRLASNDSGTGWEAGARVHFLEMFSMGAMYSMVDGDDSMNIDARWSF